MNRYFFSLMVSFNIPFCALAQKTSQSYAGQEAREIKALSPDEVTAYLEGHGMGFAKAAELNHYPGPKHVLELAEKLKLTQEQISETQAIYDKMHSEAIHAGNEIIAHEMNLDSSFAAGTINDAQLAVLVNEIARLQGEARIIHLRAHLSMKKMLTPAQIGEYDKLRGYDQPSGMKHHQHNH